MSEWKRGEKLDNKNKNNNNNKNNNWNKNNNKTINKGSDFVRSKSFEQYKKKKNQNHKNKTNNYNPNNYNPNNYNPNNYNPNNYNPNNYNPNNYNPNNYNPNNNGYDLSRSVSFDIHNLRSRQQELKVPENNIIVPPSENIPLEPIDSKWKDAIEKINDKFANYVDESDPKYWNGPYWIGPITVRVEKKKTKGYENYMNILKNAQVKPSTIIMPLCKTTYSRNNKDWYDTKQETYSKEELEAIKEYEFKMKNDKYAIWCEMNYQRRKRESEKYFYETGELDTFAIVEKEHAEYEEYLKNIEEEDYYDEDLSDDE
jgi:hypothetical protein